MIAYIVRRIVYAIPILIGVNVLTFALFFVVNTPEDMARMQLGAKRVTPEAIERWKAERGYDKPLLWNAQAQGVDRLTETIFFEKSLRLFAFDFGNADDGRDIGHEIGVRVETRGQASVVIMAILQYDDDGDLEPDPIPHDLDEPVIA